VIRAAVHERGIDCLVGGDSQACRLALVTCVEALEHLPDLMPAVTANALIVRANRPLRLGAMLARAGEHARLVFGAEPTFAPVSPWVRLVLRARCRGIALTAGDWGAAFPGSANPVGGVLAGLAGRTSAQR
jgi:hypothetical protein